jgi:putative flavoprotein involved in K+ transport
MSAPVHTLWSCCGSPGGRVSDLPFTKSTLNRTGFLLSHVFTVRTPIGRRVRQQLSHRGLPLARVRRNDLVRAGVERMPRVTGVRDLLPTLATGEALDLANVIWCTGFRSDFSWIDLPVFNQDGEPRHQRGIVRSEPGLYLIGLFFLSAGTSSLIGGVGRDARHITRHLASQSAKGSGAKPEATGTSEKASD